MKYEICGKVHVAWKHKMLHDVMLHDVIGGYQAIYSKKKRKMGHQILQLACKAGVLCSASELDFRPNESWGEPKNDSKAEFDTSK